MTAEPTIDELMAQVKTEFDASIKFRDVDTGDYIERRHRSSEGLYFAIYEILKCSAPYQGGGVMTVLSEIVVWAVENDANYPNFKKVEPFYEAAKAYLK